MQYKIAKKNKNRNGEKKIDRKNERHRVKDINRVS